MEVKNLADRGRLRRPEFLIEIAPNSPIPQRVMEPKKPPISVQTEEEPPYFELIRVILHCVILGGLLAVAVGLFGQLAELRRRLDSLPRATQKPRASLNFRTRGFQQLKFSRRGVAFEDLDVAASGVQVSLEAPPFLRAHLQNVDSASTGLSKGPPPVFPKGKLSLFGTELFPSGDVALTLQRPPGKNTITTVEFQNGEIFALEAPEQDFANTFLSTQLQRDGKLRIEFLEILPATLEESYQF